MSNPLDPISVQLQAASSSFNLLKSDLNKLGAGIIVSPIPPPPPMRPISPTAFQVSPYAEKILVDPYKTIELDVLSKDQLAVDNVIDYLSSVVPPELLDELKKLPDIANYLVAKGKDLSSVVYGIMGKLPSLSDLSEVLRNSSLMTIINNVDSFVTSAINAGENINTMASSVIANAFSFIDQATNIIGSVEDNVSNVITDASLLYATIVDIPAAATQMFNTLVNAGVDSVGNFVSLLSNVGSDTFYSFAHVVNSVDQSTAVNACTAIHILGKTTYNANVSAITTLNNNTLLTNVANVTNVIGYTNVSAIATVVSTNGAAVTNSMPGFTEYQSADLTIIINFINANSLAAAEGILTHINAVTLTQMQTLLLSVTALGVPGYIAAHGNGIYTNVLTDMTNYGIPIAQALTDCLAIDSSVNLIAFMTSVSTLGTSANTLLSIVTSFGPSNLQTIVTAFTSVSSLVVTQAMTIVTTLTPGGTLAALAINALLASGALSNLDVTSFITTAANVPVVITTSNIPQIQSLTPAKITTIINAIAVNEIYTKVSNANLNGELLDYTVRSLALSAAKNGNYKQILNILANYAPGFTTDYNRYLVTTLLANYSITKDDTAMGLSNASTYFVNALNAIYQNWNGYTRNTTPIGLLAPYVTASKDSITLLLKNPTMALQAIIQYDNKYS